MPTYLIGINRMGKLYSLKEHPKMWSKIKMKKITIQNLELSFNTECSAEQIESLARDVLERMKKIAKANGVSLEQDSGMTFTLKVDLEEE